MKMFVIFLLALMGIYWLFGHFPPFPFSHEQLGLYYHDIHRIMGIIFFVLAGIVWFKWNPKKK